MFSFLTQDKKDKKVKKEVFIRVVGSDWSTSPCNIDTVGRCVKLELRRQEGPPWHVCKMSCSTES